MKWSEVLDNPVLCDLPFKIELNEFGQIVLSPISNKQGVLKSDIGVCLEEMSGNGCAIINCSIQTKKNVKVADVVWCSGNFLAKNNYETPYQEAPEVCVEIVSRSNSKREMSEKRKLYFERGAREVWLCYENGKVEFYHRKGATAQSEMFPQFPKEIEVSWR